MCEGVLLYYEMNIYVFSFLRYCLGNKGNMSDVVTGMDWRQRIPLLLNKQFSDSVSTALSDLERYIRMN